MEIGSQDAVRDHVGFLAGHALVVVVAAPAKEGEGSVVDYVDALTAYLLADFAGEDRLALAVEVGFEGVAHGFVEQDSGGSRAHHDAHLASGRAAGLEHGIDPVRGFGRDLGYQLVREEFDSHSEAARGGFRLDRAFALVDYLYAQARHRTDVGGELAERVVHQYFAD